MIIDELLEIAKQSMIVETAVKAFDMAHEKDGVDLCANHWPGNQVHVYSGIASLAKEVGAKLTSTLHHDGITVERSFDCNGVHFYQLGRDKQ